MRWEYRKINLNDLPRRTDEIDLLCQAGEDGWELVTLLLTNVAYLKRPLHQQVEQEANEAGVTSVTRDNVPKYRDPATGQTWSGRGRMAGWLKAKQDAGEDIERYRV